jgi:D-ribulokinase
VVLPACPEPVLLGAAMSGAVASGTSATLADAARAMVSTGPATSPNDGAAIFQSHQRRAYRLLKTTERQLRNWPVSG